MKKFPKIFFLALLIIIFSGCSQNENSKVKIGDKYVCQAEIADNIISRAQGLSGRENLEKNECMLFVFKESKSRTFWMKNMNFPLDIIFINNNEIVEIKENIQAPDSADIPQYSSKYPADTVLELPAGLVADNNIITGDKVDRK